MSNNKNVIEWVKRNPEKDKAHRAMRYAIKTGKLIRGVCEVCGNEKVDGHHDDYSKPLEVRWLCRRHHADVHKGRENIKSESEKISPPTNLEILALETANRLGNSDFAAIILEALTKASRTTKQIEQWEQNRRNGGKPGRKDKKPRVRRSIAQIEADNRRTRAELEAIQDKGATK